MNVEWILSSSGLILLVLLVRFLFRRRIPPCLRYALWLTVALRLLVPVSFLETEISILNLLPGQETEEAGQSAKSEQMIGETIRKPDSTLAAFDVPSQPENLNAGNHTKAGNMENVEAKKSDIQGEGKAVEVSEVLRLFWLLGAGICGGVFLGVNLVYSRQLKRSRKNIAPENLPVIPEVPVYETPMVQTPCLFGVFVPAVYVTEDVVEEDKIFRFVLCHENTHYRQHDHWWALVRIICLCVHWFNPLVWLGARLSRQDGEMSCDERTLKLLGKRACADYGRALLELSAEKNSRLNGLRISTSISGNARQMRERLRMLVNAPGRTTSIQILVMIFGLLFSVITFTGKSRAQEKEDLELAQADQLAEGLEADVSTEDLKSNNRIENDVVFSKYDGGDIQAVDLNFDGWNDLCFQGWHRDDADAPYCCMLWNPENGEYEYSAMLWNVNVDAERQWIYERTEDGAGQSSTVYYRYDEENQLHMVRYVEENKSSDAVFVQLDLTYVEEGSIYILPAIVDETNLHRTLLSMAKQSLVELYHWTGEKVDTACFQITNMGGVSFGMTPEDIGHSRTFFSRNFGADTAYNLSNYEKSISSVYVTSGRSVWYSPVLWRIFPEEIDEMTDEEIMIWYLERIPLVEECHVKSIEKRYEDMWTIQTEEGTWFEVVYDTKLREVGMVSGPYPDYPVH